MKDTTYYSDLLQQLSRHKVLIIGDVMVDAYLFGKVERISPEAPVPIVSVSKRENRLGGAANVALNISALGASPILCSVIGNDLKGNEFIELMQKEGMTTRGIIQSEKRITTTKFRVIGNKMQLLRVDEEIDTTLDSGGKKEFVERIKSIMHEESIDVIIFQDYDKGVIDNSLIRDVVAHAKSAKIPVVVDPKRRNFIDYTGVTLFKPNLKELREGLKMEIELSNMQQLDLSLDMFMENQNIEIVLATLSESGVYIKKRNANGSMESHIVPAHLRSISDVSGAGDTVVSVAALCLAEKLEPLRIAEISNIAGGLVCEELGVVPVNRQRLEKELTRLLA